MLTSVSIFALSLLAFYSVSQYRSIRKHLQEAKQSGFKYVFSPVYFQSIPWIILSESLSPFILKLPTAWTESWFGLSVFGRLWHEGYSPFSKLGDDNIMMVSASGNILWTCDPEVIMQVMDHREYAKPLEMLDMLNLYGPTITASEGDEYRAYRKVTYPSFNNSNHRLVWTEAIHQAQMMLGSWNANDGQISNLNKDAAKMALHVISMVFFDKKMHWTDDAKKAPPGHTLTYHAALSSVLEYNSTLFMTPRPIINYSPMKIHKLAKEAFVEWGKYMTEMRDETANSLKNSDPTEDGTLLENLVKAGTQGLGPSDSSIPPEAIFGNMFIFILAGHETSSNTFTHAVSLLACRPEFQKSLQAEIDALSLGRSAHKRSYEEAFPKLMSGHVGALMKETLRLYTVVPFLPKINNERPQTLKVGQRTCTLPLKTLVMVNTSATHRNPKHWPPVTKTAADDAPFPVSSFAPERWLESSPEGEEKFNPEPGAYIPFAEGYRTCMGQHFARAEFCAAILTIFSEYSVELHVEEGQKFEHVLQAAEQQLSSGVGFSMGLKMKKPVLLKLVRR